MNRAYKYDASEDLLRRLTGGYRFLPSPCYSASPTIKIDRTCVPRYRDTAPIMAGGNRLDDNFRAVNERDTGCKHDAVGRSARRSRYPNVQYRTGFGLFRGFQRCFSDICHVCLSFPSEHGETFGLARPGRVSRFPIWCHEHRYSFTGPPASEARGP